MSNDKGLAARQHVDRWIRGPWLAAKRHAEWLADYTPRVPPRVLRAAALSGDDSPRCMAVGRYLARVPGPAFDAHVHAVHGLCLAVRRPLECAGSRTPAHPVLRNVDVRCRCVLCHERSLGARRAHRQLAASASGDAFPRRRFRPVGGGILGNLLGLASGGCGYLHCRQAHLRRRPTQGLRHAGAPCRGCGHLHGRNPGDCDPAGPPGNQGAGRRRPACHGPARIPGTRSHRLAQRVLCDATGGNGLVRRQGRSRLPCRNPTARPATGQCAWG